MNHLIDSLEYHDEVTSWINESLVTNEGDEAPSQPKDLTELDQQITQLLTNLDIAAEDTSTQLERLIDDVSRGIPRLAYDLHFMKDGASTLQNALVVVLKKSQDATPAGASAALSTLHNLDTIKRHMEAAREVLREAESWSTLDHEVTSLIGEKTYVKAAERLSEANKSIAVFQNTPEYDPRRTLMVNLQNQLEAELSTALLSAITARDLIACKEYHSIFSVIQRESEFRNYYYASRRSSLVLLWQNAVLSDCEPEVTSDVALSFASFLPNFFTNFTSLLDDEMTSISAIFPDPAVTLSHFISSTLSSLQPSMQQRLSSVASHYGDSALPYLISSLQATEEFAVEVEKTMEKLKFATSTLLPAVSLPDKIHRRRSSRMSISLRPGQHRNSVGNSNAVADALRGMEWDQDLFQPFTDFQVDYGSLERRCLEQLLYGIVPSDTREQIQPSDRPRLFRERAVDIFGLAESSLNRCNMFTHGYGAACLLQAIDAFFQYFIDMWTADLQLESHSPASPLKHPIADTEFSDLDYSTQDWSDIQLSLHLLSAAKSVYGRMLGFEAKLRAYLGQIAAHFRSAMNNPSDVLVAATRGESQLLEQSTLNSAELHTLLLNVENDAVAREPPFSASLRHQPPPPTNSIDPLLMKARESLFMFAQTCQSFMIDVILSPLKKHLTGYASSPIWRSAADPNISISSTDLKVPTFSLSPTEMVQRVAEGLLNLPRLFEDYADDDALAFSLETLPCVDAATLKSFMDQTQDVANQAAHWRGPPNYVKPTAVDAETVSSAWLLSLGHTFLEHLTSYILPTITSLTVAGAAQLLSDLEYLSNIVRVLNVEHMVFEKWKNYMGMNQDNGVRLVAEIDPSSLDPVLGNIAKLRGWR